MSLNRYEQALFDYWEKNADEKRHWQGKVGELTTAATSITDLSRALERDLWSYWMERSQHVPAIKTLGSGSGSRVSLLNLAEYVIRLWGPPPKPRRPSSTR